MKIKEVLEYYPIMEMLNTKFDSLTWTEQRNQLIGIGNIAKTNTTVRVTITPITYANHQGLNLIFAVYDGKNFVEVFQNKNTTDAASIIGAVTNAFRDKIAQYDWTFITLIAKDNLETRGRLYVRIADRLRQESRAAGAEFDINGARVILITKLLSSETQVIIDKMTHGTN